MSINHHNRELSDLSVRSQWLGIPFAQAPVDKLRWKPPQALSSWEGIRDATNFGAACPQSPNPLVNMKFTNISEDCMCNMPSPEFTLPYKLVLGLYLNVFSPPSPGYLLPVMLFIHGGGYTLDDSSDPGYWAYNLSMAGNVVVVTINYRLGIFGFLVTKVIITQICMTSSIHRFANYP